MLSRLKDTLLLVGDAQGGREGKRSDCFVKVYGPEDGALESTQINVSDGLLTGVKIPVQAENGVFPVAEHIFDNDALVFAS